MFIATRRQTDPAPTETQRLVKAVGAISITSLRDCDKATRSLRGEDANDANRN
jgi:hypothetical protein